MTIPRDATGGPREALGRQSERRKFQQLAQALMREVQAKAEIRRLAPNIRFTETREGLRIDIVDDADFRSEEHTSELQSLMRISYAVFCLKKKKNNKLNKIKEVIQNRQEKSN